MRVILAIDIPQSNDLLDVDAVVVALKSRNVVADDAVEQSLRACSWLRRQGTRQYYFKICSTFDSTPKGNIGPVIEALMRELNCPFSTVIPAFPENHRTVYQGHMFVGGVLLSESGMRHHPLNPMTDANLVRFLQSQLSGAHRTGLIEFSAVSKSSLEIRKQMLVLRDQGVTIALADAVTEDDIDRLAEALKDEVFVTASSGLGLALPSKYGFHSSDASSRIPSALGYSAILSGSCSTATHSQLHHLIENGGAACPLDLDLLATNTQQAEEQVLRLADNHFASEPDRPFMIYSSTDYSEVQRMQNLYGVERSGAMIERAFASLARALVSRGVGRLIITGGEISGVCARAIGATKLQIGPQIDPGVPWCYGISACSPRGPINLALKSGNFGGVDFFFKAFAQLDRELEPVSQKL